MPTFKDERMMPASKEKKNTRELARIRSQIATVYERMLTLLAKRLELARKAKKIKTGLGQPVIDRRMELVVRELHASVGEALELDPQLTSKLSRLLVSSARAEQQ